MSKDPYKVALLGESGVGKTCILSHIINGKFDPHTIQSAGAEYKRISIKLPEGKTINFDIWDTAGQERYRSLIKIFYKDAKVIILVYDVTKGKSFLN